jgi:AraC-like DNA-binding protein
MQEKVFNIYRDEYPNSHHYIRRVGYPHWLIAYRVSGSSMTRVNDKEMVVEGGWLILIPPNEEYEVRAADNNKEAWVSYWTNFQPSEAWLKLIDDLPKIPIGYGINIRATPYEKAVAATFTEATNWHHTAQPHREGFIKNTLERIFYLAIKAGQTDQAKQLDDRIRHAMQYLQDNLQEAHTIAELAEEVHLSKPRFANLFKGQTGVSPMRYLETLRIAQAQKLLLSTNMPINQISREVGYSNPFHFTTRFQRRVKQSPRAYRHNPATSPISSPVSV